mgnify:CR=1 FL=1
MRKAIYIFLIIIIIVLAFQIFKIRNERLNIKGQLKNIRAQKESLENENRKLKADISYFSFLENLEKEAKTQFNFIQPGEKLIIVVPKK